MGKVAASPQPAVSATSSGAEDAAADSGFGHGEGSGTSQCAVYSHRTQQLELLGAHEAHSVQLGRREWDLFTLSPVECAGGASWAPLGLASMLNGGGAILASSLSPRALGGAQASVTLRASGAFVAYCRPRPRGVKVDGRLAKFEYDEDTGLLKLPMARQARPVEISVWLPRSAR